MPGRHALVPASTPREVRPRTRRPQPPQPAPRSHRNRRRAALTGTTLAVAFGLCVTSAMSATASPLGSGEAASATTAAAAQAIGGQTVTVGDVAGQKISWDSYGATSAAVLAKATTDSEVSAAIAAATAQLATTTGREELPSDVAASTTLTGDSGTAMVAYALQYVGKVPYVLGGNTPATGFSCDTFVEYVYAAFGIVMTGDVDAIAVHGTVISKSEAKAGDLVYYPHEHIGIYDGDGGIIDAPKPGKYVSHRAVWGSPEYIRIRA